MVTTRTIRYRDGRQEIFRILSTTDLKEWKKDGPLSYEKSIVWLENIERLRFVRVAEIRCATSRRGRLRVQGRQRVIGYSKLMADAPRNAVTRQYTRRLFYLKESDDLQRIPSRGQLVDPRTVLPGIVGSAPLSSVTKSA